ncbi:MAG TPA: 16S rRNA (uracil(1498)-N(3))-methyltransferase [Candidatus Krumholzibacteria bacterium]|nr:16S rRNA (uracil(1498)-N(3))-methyltransferase [Candidatus Krumholzibacteria bacterium]
MSAHSFSFYSAELTPSDPRAWITDDEHFHLSRVLRMGTGDTVRVTNGRGLIVTAEIEDVGAKRTSARVSNVEANLPEPVPLVLALGMLPRTHMDGALTQCVEAGITGFIPVVAERCHAKRVTGGRDERWMRVAIAAMKQSGRGWLPQIEPALDVTDLVARFASFEAVLVADADAGHAPGVGVTALATLGIVGPEAGFTDFERLRIQEGGAKAVRLSAQRLRAETAALALVAMLAVGRSAV